MKQSDDDDQEMARCRTKLPVRSYVNSTENRNSSAVNSDGHHIQQAHLQKKFKSFEVEKVNLEGCR